MQKQAPTVGRILIMSAFTLSCFGLLLYLWSAFGGPVPLKPRGYEFKASFAEATQLAQEADVRISGVTVGKVKKIELGDDGRSEATIEVNEKYAPVRSDSRAILRQKTLLGETYIELTPGTNGAPYLPEGAKLATSRIAPTVELDEIFRSFDAKTRKAFQTWQQGVAQGIQGHAEDFSDALGSLDPFAEDSNRVFETTAQRDEGIRGTFRALPTFIDESKRALRRLESYAANTDPLVSKLHPWARAASDTLQSVKRAAPDFNRFIQALGPAVTAANRGFPAGARFLDDLRPLLGQLDPFLRNFNPFLRYLSLYRREFGSFFANIVAATGYNDQPGKDLRALRLSIPVNPESLALYPRRLGPNRANPYFLPGGYDKLAQGLETFHTANCGRGGYPDLAPAGPNFPQALRDAIFQFFYQG